MKLEPISVLSELRIERALEGDALSARLYGPAWRAQSGKALEYTTPDYIIAVFRTTAGLHCVVTTNNYTSEVLRVTSRKPSTDPATAEAMAASALAFVTRQKPE